MLYGKGWRGAQTCAEVSCVVEQVWESIRVGLGGWLAVGVCAHTVFKLGLTTAVSPARGFVLMVREEVSARTKWGFDLRNATLCCCVPSEGAFSTVTTTSKVYSSKKCV